MNIENIIQQLDWHREPYGLYEPIEYTLAAGGKRLRPQLCLMAAEMFGGKAEEALAAALALEVFHNFTLLHDDLMDNAPTRRGRETVHLKFGANTAILSGDQMLIEAYRQLEGVPQDKLPQVLRWFTEMATQICEGQQYDMEFEKRGDVSLDEYINMIRLKTSVLLANALRTGAYIAGAKETDQQLMYDFGINLGLAFQIQDDLLDTYGEQKTFGKQIGGDIMEDKKTFLLLTAIQRGYDAGTQPSSVAEEKIAAVTAAYNRLGVKQAAEEAIEDYTQKALDCLQKVSATDQKKEELTILTQILLKRNH